MALNKNNFYYIIQLFLFKIEKEKLVNVWTHHLQNLIYSSSVRNIPKNSFLIPNIINKNNKEILDQLRLIYGSNKTIFEESYPRIKYFYSLYDSKPTKFFMETIEKHLNSEKFSLALSFHQDKKLNRSLTQSIIELREISGIQIDEEEEILLSVKYPFLPPLTKKSNENLINNPQGTDNKFNFSEEFPPLTVVLDLDETLISFKMEESKEKGVLRMRPGLLEFLSELKKRNCEPVVYTASTQDYADPICDAIEAEEKFFICRLYRQHSVIINNEFVKDLSKLGRDLSRVIIVDNNDKNFILQQKNGILIKAFNGTDGA